jgi:hypothetical protein
MKISVGIPVIEVTANGAIGFHKCSIRGQETASAGPVDFQRPPVERYPAGQVFVLAQHETAGTGMSGALPRPEEAGDGGDPASWTPEGFSRFEECTDPELVRAHRFMAPFSGPVMMYNEVHSISNPR